MQAHEYGGLYPPMFQVFLASSHKDPTLQGGKIKFTGAESGDLVYDLYLDPPDTTAASHPSTSKIRFLYNHYYCFIVVITAQTAVRVDQSFGMCSTPLFFREIILCVSCFRNKRPSGSQVTAS